MFGVFDWLQNLCTTQAKRKPTKGLFFSPIGDKERKTITKLLNTISSSHKFDFILVAYDQADWSNERWFNNVEIVYNKTGQKWALAYELITSKYSTLYSHVFIWDSDIAPGYGFDIEQLLEIAQENKIDALQPGIQPSRLHEQLGDLSCGYKRKIKTETSPILVPASEETFEAVEIMVPIYSMAYWMCLRSFMPTSVEGWGTGWGIDSYGKCACPVQHFLVTSNCVRHMDFKTSHNPDRDLVGNTEKNHWKCLCRKSLSD